MVLVSPLSLDIGHIKGKENIVVDSLSRAPWQSLVQYLYIYSFSMSLSCFKCLKVPVAEMGCDSMEERN